MQFKMPITNRKMHLFIKAIQIVFYFVSNIICIPYVRGQEIVASSKINLIFTFVLLNITVISSFYDVTNPPPFARSGIGLLSIYYDFVKVLTTLITSYANLLLNYKCLHHIANEVLALNCLSNYTILREMFIVLGFSFAWLIVYTFLNMYYWKFSGSSSYNILFYVCKITLGFYCFFIFQIFLNHVRIVHYSFININLRLMSIWDGKDCTDISLSVNKKVYKGTVAGKLNHLASLHNKLCDLAWKINFAYSAQVFIMVAAAFVDVNFCLLFTIFTAQYYQLMNAHHVDFIFVFIMLQLTTFFDMAKWFQITSTCSRTSKEVIIILRL